MATIQDIPHPAARLRSTVGAALATLLGALIAIGVGVLIITSVSSSQTVRTPLHAAPCSEACSGGGHPSAQHPHQLSSRQVKHAYGARP